MRLVTVRSSEGPWLGRLHGDAVLPLDDALEAIGLPVGSDLAAIIASGAAAWSGLDQASSEGSSRAVPLADVSLDPPLIPSTIICGGANFADHLDETHRERPTHVEFLLKSPTGVVGPRDDVRMDPLLSTKYDYEVELAVVIGRAARDVPRDAALDHVFGYTIINDVSIRDQQVVPWDTGRFQLRFGQGKSYQDSAPLGPWVVTADELPDVNGLALRTRVDGILRQNNSMANILWDVPALISYYSTFMTLVPGLVIACGTPGGPALGSDLELGADPYRRDDGVQRGAYVAAGQLVECEIEGIGKLANRYVLG
jgi:2-keto-4-pentenoate hydratase/2-oxohepta-3-ene-1,7-dioic acid hydratase in catechol pathway